MTSPTIETERLILRPPIAADFDAFCAFGADPVASRFLGGVMPPSGVWRVLCTLVGAWELQGFAMFSYVEKASGAWVGRGGPWMPHGWPGTEVGWGVATEFQRRGYAKEAAIASIDWAFETLGWTDVIHCIDPLNTASIAVATSIGSQLKRRNVPAPAPILATWDLYGQSREEWRARRAR